MFTKTYNYTLFFFVKINLNVIFLNLNFKISIKNLIKFLGSLNF